MEKDAKESLSQLADKLSIHKQTRSNHIRNIFVASLNAIPSVGSILASLAESYIPEQKGKRLIKFVEEIAKEVDRIKNKIDSNFVQSEEFAYIFERTFKLVIENYQKEKIQCYKAVLLNSMIHKDNLKEEERDLFIHMIDNLTVRHIKFLRLLKDPIKFDQENNNAVGMGGRLSTSLMEILAKCFPEYSRDEISFISQDLTNKGVAQLSSLGMTITDQGINHLKNKLTAFGQKLVNFILMD